MSERKPEPMIDKQGVRWCQVACCHYTPFRSSHAINCDLCESFGSRHMPTPCLPAVREMAAKVDRLRECASNRPEVVCLCGSTRFINAYNEARKRHTYQGRIVLSIEIITSQAREADPQFCNPGLKAMLDELHLRKIDMADFVEILNVDGYIGESTRNEIEYCHTIGRRIEYLVPIEAAETASVEV